MSLSFTQLRNLVSLRRRFKKDEHAVRMQIRNGLVSKYFPELDRHWSSCLTENLAIVRWCLDPRKITDMGFEEFVRQGHSTEPRPPAAEAAGADLRGGHCIDWLSDGCSG